MSIGAVPGGASCEIGSRNVFKHTGHIVLTGAHGHSVTLCLGGLI